MGRSYLYEWNGRCGEHRREHQREWDTAGSQLSKECYVWERCLEEGQDEGRDDGEAEDGVAAFVEFGDFEALAQVPGQVAAAVQQVVGERPGQSELNKRSLYLTVIPSENSVLYLSSLKSLSLPFFLYQLPLFHG